MTDYWYVRERPNPALFHLLAQDTREPWGAWREQPAVQVLCGQRLVQDPAFGRWDTQYEGDMLGWPLCLGCTRKVDPTAGGAERSKTRGARR